MPPSADGKLPSGRFAFLAAATLGVAVALDAAVTATDTDAAGLGFTDVAAAVTVRVALVADVSLAGTLICACSWRALELSSATVPMLHDATPFCVPQPKVNVPPSGEGAAFRLSVTPATEPFCSHTLTV